MHEERHVAETIVKTTCRTCGDVELAPTQLELRVCSVPERSVYAFNCPSCGISVLKPAADPRVITLLRSVGVPTVGWEIPAEILEPREGDPITNDDILDLMLALDDPNFIERLAAARTSSR
jgi:predicted RNA-binding Zn-ribbon protein involved in translation (DUF1610 family)